MEYLDIVDENGLPTGQVVERAAAHRDGVRHRTAHVWMLRKRAGQVEVLLQKRSLDKDSFPGCYDISSAGHIPAGEDFVPSALRELWEELGVAASPEDLCVCGVRRFYLDASFRGRPFRDNQVSKIFCLWYDGPEDGFTLQESEVAAVKWMPFDACYAAVRDDTFPHAIVLEELDMVQAWLRAQGERV